MREKGESEMYELFKKNGFANDTLTQAQNKVANVLNSNQQKRTASKNPFLNSSGTLTTPYVNFQKVLDSAKTSNRAKQYIQEATGISQSAAAVDTQSAGAATPTQKAKSYTVNADSGKSGIVEAAKNYIGTPYVWGGKSAAEGGMDCSGFVYNALKDAGYNVGRTTAQGYRNYGTSVSKNNMQPGDLVFFGKNGKASHVGIYMGNGQMIHSSGGSSNTKSNPGKGVSVTNVNYRSDFLEARRY